MAWKPKVDDNGSLVLKDGIPVWTDEENGREAAVDVNELHGKILTKGREAQGYQNELKAMKERYQTIAHIDDLSQFVTDAEKARETIAALEEKDVRKAETVEKIKGDMRTQFVEKEQKLRSEFDEKLKENQETVNSLLEQIKSLMIDSQFDTCPFFNGAERKTTLTPDAAKALFRQYFALETSDDGKKRVVARWPSGDPIYASDGYDKFAEFNDAIQQIWDKYPHRDHYTPSRGGGSGATGGTDIPSGKGATVPQLQELLAKTKNAAEAVALETAIFNLQQAQRKGGGG